MKRWMGATLALGLVAAGSAPAFAECPGHNVSADAGTKAPIVTADTVAKPVATDDKG